MRADLDGIFFGVFVGQGKRDVNGDSAAASLAFQITDSIYSTVRRFHNKAGNSISSLGYLQDHT